MDLTSALSTIQAFGGADLTLRLAQIEASLVGATQHLCTQSLHACGATNEALAAAGTIKHLVGQINVIIHALGILLCLPHVLEEGEIIDYVSLGAGNTGRRFDLETSHRIAEFKFIRWQGGPEAIRQNTLFKDFYGLAEYETGKRKCLYVLGTTHPLKFFNGNRALTSVLHTAAMQRQFRGQFGDQFQTVRDYYLPRRHLVEILDVSNLVPELVNLGEGGSDVTS